MAEYPSSSAAIQRMRVVVQGAVQGVGFRPFVYRLASGLSLPGWVVNSAQGVFIEVEGKKLLLDCFLLRLQKDLPPRAFVQSLEFSFLDPVGFTTFEIRESDSSGEKTALVLPDIAICPDCRREIFDPSNRRYRYPFTNCTNCGPRFTIIERLPYDRCNTSMRNFRMCDDCRREYENPVDRRFHAQPNACPACGPHLELWDERGAYVTRDDDALQKGAGLIKDGRIVAVKGLGGFHLMVDAGNQSAVERLRARKHREEKPFALMARRMEDIRTVCEVSAFEERLLTSPESPIVLLRRQASAPDESIAASVAPANPYLGIMLPYTPLHHLLMEAVGAFVVATSGNLADEPICTEEHEAVLRLAGIVDAFLVHNRPIVRHVDDSIGRVILGRELVIRRARGYAPLPARIHDAKPDVRLLAVGPHLKNTVAVVKGNNAFISQHIGDLETKESLDAFYAVVHDLQDLFDCRPSLVASDMHPDYVSSRYARASGLPVLEVQHHVAHVASCMAENELEGEVLGISWDGTGYGPDGTIWGGEFLVTDGGEFTRLARFRPFRLPGGDTAVRQPRRSALGLLFEMDGEASSGRREIPTIGAFRQTELEVLKQALKKGVNSPFTSSVGRLFDAAASLLGVRQIASFEGQAAMEMEFLTAGVKDVEPFSVAIRDRPFHEQSGDATARAQLEVDWSSMIRDMLKDSSDGVPNNIIAARFHRTLVETIVSVALKAEQERVVLSGGCFQNRVLTERAVHRLRESGFRPYWHQRVPPNDGGISLGQAYAAVRVAGKRH